MGCKPTQLVLLLCRYLARANSPKLEDKKQVATDQVTHTARRKRARRESKHFRAVLSGLWLGTSKAMQHFFQRNHQLYHVYLAIFSPAYHDSIPRPQVPPKLKQAS